MKDVFELPVFEAADVFPMMTEDEINELAEDIRVNSLHEPLVLAEVDGETMLIDGRNRREACKIAGVEPHTRTLDGEDPTAFVLSANIHRRHMTKGQRAMAVAKIYPGGSGKGANPKNLGLSDELIRQGRTVLQYAPDLAAGVLAGSPRFPTLETAVEKKMEDQTEFVRWWEEKVTPRHRPVRSGNKLSADRRVIPMEQAEQDTEISHQQVSRWRSRLKKPEKYREMLYGAAQGRPRPTPQPDLATAGTLDSPGRRSRHSGGLARPTMF